VNTNISREVIVLIDFVSSLNSRERGGFWVGLAQGPVHSENNFKEEVNALLFLPTSRTTARKAQVT
jgi:hypothetical protein